MGTQQREDIRRFLHPRSVAIVGKLGGARSGSDTESILAAHRKRWGDTFYLVSPKGGTYGDAKVYPSVLELPETVDLAVLNVGPANLAAVVEECQLAGVTNVVIYSSGFSEIGEAGAAAEEELRRLVTQFGMRALGPNTNTNAFDRPPTSAIPGGRIGLVTQSGNQGRPIVQAANLGIVLSRWVATGNEMDLDVADFIEYFAGDDATSVIAAYVEGFRDGEKLRAALTAANHAEKPVVCIKIGRTEAGAAMASSHTGHLTGSDAVIDGLFAQHGVIRVDDLDELIETTALFAKVRADTGPRAAAYGMSGGATTLMAELAQQHGVQLPTLAPDTVAELRTILPTYLSMSNPIDNGMQFVMAAPSERRQRVLELLANDPSIDVIITAINDAESPFTAAFVADLISFRSSNNTPISLIWATPRPNEPLLQSLVEAGIPVFRSTRGCMRAWQRFCTYQEARGGFRARRVEPGVTRHELPADTVGVLSTDETNSVLSAFGISLPRGEIASERREAATVATAIGFPVAMKIASPDFPHKSDVGLVRLGISDAAAAEQAFTELITQATTVDANARIEGVLIQQQLEGTEMIVGVTQDPTLGAAIMVGLGGIFTEVLSDTAVRPLPVDRLDVEQMVRSLRGFALLNGARGRPLADLERFYDLVLSVAELAQSCGDRLSELDLNPVVVTDRHAVALDALMIVGAIEEQSP